MSKYEELGTVNAFAERHGLADREQALGEYTVVLQQLRSFPWVEALPVDREERAAWVSDKAFEFIRQSQAEGKTPEGMLTEVPGEAAMIYSPTLGKMVELYDFERAGNTMHMFATIFDGTKQGRKYIKTAPTVRAGTSAVWQASLSGEFVPGSFSHTEGYWNTEDDALNDMAAILSARDAHVIDKSKVEWGR
jgi:hypothetical protein